MSTSTAIDDLGVERAHGGVVVTVQHYRDLLGARVEARAGRPVLILGGPVVGLATTPAVGRYVLLDLQRTNNDGPIIEYPGSRSRWLFLADPNGAVMGSDALPPQVELIAYHASVVLPESHRSVRWVNPPTGRRRWLPTVAAVLGSASAVDLGSPLPEPAHG